MSGQCPEHSVLGTLVTDQLVAHGQYVISDTHCPALQDCEFEWGKQPSGPEGYQVL